MDRNYFKRHGVRLFITAFWAFAFASITRGQAPVFEITPLNSTIRFDVKASVDIAGKDSHTSVWQAYLVPPALEFTAL